MRILITCGPTQEPIDDVRYITNASSGRMGIALAKEAINASHDTTLIAGSISVKIPTGIKTINVRTSEDMIVEVKSELESGYDVLISAAAIADFKPEKKLRGKTSSKESLTLNLIPTEKLTRTVKKEYPGVYVVGFKAEYNVGEATLLARAKKKMSDEALDMIVANDIGRDKFGSKEREVYIMDADGVDHVRKSDLRKVAEMIINRIPINP